jgi:hypothetical protein
VQVTSQPDQGSEFTVFIPAEPPGAVSQATDLPETKAHLTVA